jgi:hypothetical protein
MSIFETDKLFASASFINFTETNYCILKNRLAIHVENNIWVIIAIISVINGHLFLGAWHD